MAKQFNSNNFKQEVLKTKLPVLVDFFATWCPPCQAELPVIEQLAEEYKDKIKIGKFNIEDGTEIAQEYNVMSVPTLIFFKNGQEIKRLSGFHSKEDLKKEIKGFVQNYEAKL